MEVASCSGRNRLKREVYESSRHDTMSPDANKTSPNLTEAESDDDVFFPPHNVTSSVLTPRWKITSLLTILRGPA